MSRFTRLALALGALTLVVAGSVLASPAPRDTAPELLAASHQPEAPVTAAEVAHAADRLAASGIDIGQDRLAALANEYGLGGAVRMVAWADEKGISIADLRAMRADGAGWGQIAKELGLHPGLGSIMGNGNGHGKEKAPGQQ